MLEKPKLVDAQQKSKDLLDAKVIDGSATEDTNEKLCIYQTSLRKEYCRLS